MLYDVHPAIVRELEKGNTRKALELLAQTKNNKYYAELAQRLLDTGFTAKLVYRSGCAGVFVETTHKLQSR
jgi:hypothetical protein